MTLMSIISTVSLVFSGACFIVWIVLVIRSTFGNGFGDAEAHGEVKDAAELVGAFSKLIDKLNKARPHIVAFTGSIIFLIISLIAARMA